MSQTATAANDQLVSTNPGRNYEVLGNVEISSKTDVDQAIHTARQASASWRALGVEGRRECMHRLYTRIEKRREDVAIAITREMGMPISGARSSTTWALKHFAWAIENAPRCLAPTVTYEDSEEIHRQIYEPYGVAGVIVPWNFPISNFVMGAVQPLLAGNTVVYKVSEEIPLFGKLLQELVQEAALPEGVFNQIYGAGSVGELLARGAIDTLFFTGSSLVGQKLYMICAERFIPCVLELGGSDAGIIFDDADIDRDLSSIFWSKFINNGQICCGLKRLLVHRSREKELIEKLCSFVSSKKVGDPQAEDTALGPLAAERQRVLLESQVEDARKKGATVIRCSELPASVRGAYYPPTLLTNLKPGMRAWSEELFGPVLSIIPFDTEEEAIQLANATQYGLSGYIFTRDVQRFERIAAEIETGSVSMNGCDYSSPDNPFGGYKKSGLGKTGGALGFLNACRVKVLSRRK